MAKDKGEPALAAQLGGVNLFAGLPKKTLARIAAMCREQTFAAGEQIVTQGDRSGRFYLITDGHADVTVNGHIINHLGPGHYFGEYSVIDQEPRSATVTATTAVRTQSLASITLRPLLKEEPEVTYRLLLNLCERLRATQTALG
jgi:CRP-like cAMP-binding protein